MLGLRLAIRATENFISPQFCALPEHPQNGSPLPDLPILNQGTNTFDFFPCYRQNGFDKSIIFVYYVIIPSVNLIRLNER